MKYLVCYEVEKSFRFSISALTAIFVVNWHFIKGLMLLFPQRIIRFFCRCIETFLFDLKEHSQEMEIQTGNRFKISSIKRFKTPCEKMLQSFLATFFFPHKKRLQHVAVTIYSIKKFIQNENKPWFLPNSIFFSAFKQNLVLAELVCREIKEIALLTVDVADYYVPCVNELQFE